MKRVRSRYLLVEYDRSAFTSDSLRSLLLGLAKEELADFPHFKHIMFTMKPGLAVFSVPHTRVSRVKLRLSSSSHGLRVTLSSGTIEGLRRKIGASRFRKGLSEPNHA